MLDAASVNMVITVDLGRTLEITTPRPTDMQDRDYYDESPSLDQTYHVTRPSRVTESGLNYNMAYDHIFPGFASAVKKRAQVK